MISTFVPRGAVGLLAVSLALSVGFATRTVGAPRPATSAAPLAATPGQQGTPRATPVADAAPLRLPDSLVWFRTAVEYRGVVTQAYRQASAMLDRALADPSWTAALEQGQDFANKPPAVILDIDETVLDNSEFEERSARAGGAQREERWGAWCRESKAPPVPGALEFTRAARARGVTMFYVSNRDASVEQVTRQNLATVGFPLDDRRDTVLTRGERPAWTPEKATRREFVARDFRILLLVGDDFADFVPGARTTLAARRALSETHDAMWGVKWIVLPNPMYGSWKRAAGQ